MALPGFNAISRSVSVTRFVQPAAEHRELAEQGVRLRQLRVLLDGALQLGLGEVFEVQPNHHLRGDEMGGGGLCGHAEGPCEGRARAIRLADLHVGLPEDVPELQVVGGPHARGFEERERLREVPDDEMRQPEDLDRFAALDRSLRQFADDGASAARSRGRDRRRDSRRRRADGRPRPVRARRRLSACRWRLAPAPGRSAPRLGESRRRAGGCSCAAAASARARTAARRIPARRDSAGE